MSLSLSWSTLEGLVAPNVLTNVLEDIGGVLALVEVVRVAAAFVHLNRHFDKESQTTQH